MSTEPNSKTGTQNRMDMGRTVDECDVLLDLLDEHVRMGMSLALNSADAKRLLDRIGRLNNSINATTVRAENITREMECHRAFARLATLERDAARAETTRLRSLLRNIITDSGAVIPDDYMAEARAAVDSH